MAPDAYTGYPVPLPAARQRITNPRLRQPTRVASLPFAPHHPRSGRPGQGEGESTAPLGPPAAPPGRRPTLRPGGITSGTTLSPLLSNA